MPYKFEKGKIYRMPTHFGPSLGPRQGPDGRTFECKDNPKTTSISVSFLTDSDQIKAILPENFVLLGEPVVTISATYMKEIEWLVGRGLQHARCQFLCRIQWRKGSSQSKLLISLMGKFN